MECVGRNGVMQKLSCISVICSVIFNSNAYIMMEIKKFVEIKINIMGTKFYTAFVKRFLEFMNPDNDGTPGKFILKNILPRNIPTELFE